MTTEYLIQIAQAARRARDEADEADLPEIAHRYEILRLIVEAIIDGEPLPFRLDDQVTPT